MKKLKLGRLNVKALSERELKNVLGGLSTDTTTSTSSGSGTTVSKGNHDLDMEHDSDYPE